MTQALVSAGAGTLGIPSPARLPCSPRCSVIEAERLEAPSGAKDHVSAVARTLRAGAPKAPAALACPLVLLSRCSVSEPESPTIPLGKRQPQSRPPCAGEGDGRALSLLPALVLEGV